MALTYFTVTATLKAIVSDTSADVDGTPNTQNISSFVYFTPSVNQVYDTTAHTIIRLQTIRARTNPDDGVLKNIDGTTVQLVANTAELDLEELRYTVTFDHVVYDQQDLEIQGFTFIAPTDDTTIDLATVERLPLIYQIGIVAHHTRQNMADNLAHQTNPTLISVDTGTMGANANHLFVWNHLAHQNTQWSIVLEDDARPIPNFRTHLDNVLAAAPTKIVSLYLGRQRPPQHQQAITDALAKADANQAHWLIATQLYHAVAVAIRTQLLPDMLTHMRPYLPIDENIGHWSRQRGHPIAYTVPSIVNHLDGPTLIHHPDDMPRPPGRIAHRIGTHQTWNQQSVEI